MELYVLRLDMYHEWSIDCGACNLIGVYDDKSKAVEELMKCLEAEMKDNHIIEGDDWYSTCVNISDFEHSEYNTIYIDIYEDDTDYDNGKSMGTFVIEKKILNESGVII